MATLVIIKGRNLYGGRRPKRVEAKTGGALLRQPSRQSDGSTPQSQRGNYDVKEDAWLRGRDGTAHPFYDRQGKTKR